MLALGVALGAVALTAAPALAHRGHSTLSVVEIDAGTGVVTVTHQMAAHDAEPALKVIAPDAQANLDDPDAFKALAAYVNRRFVLQDAAGRRAVLALASSDLDGDDVRLVFQGRLPAPAARVTVESAIFGDVYPDEANLVNVRRKGVTRSATFAGEEAAQAIQFDGP